MNLSKFNEIKALLGDDFTKLLDVYRADTTHRLEEIEYAIEAMDFMKIRHLSHAMKSSSANIGAEEVSAIAATIEHAAKEEIAETVSDSIEGLKKAIEEAIQIMNNE